MAQRRRQQQQSAAVDEGQQDQWIWGNTRGGGGAPLKDVSGAVVTNLRQVVRGSVEVDHSSPSDRKKQHRFEDDYDDNYSDNGRDDRFISDRDRRRDPAPPSAQQSPKKFMSALRDMNGSSDERDAKYRLDASIKILILVFNESCLW